MRTTPPRSSTTNGQACTSPPEERNWVWGVIGKQAAQRLSSDAVTYFGKRYQEL